MSLLAFLCGQLTKVRSGGLLGWLSKPNLELIWFYCFTVMYRQRGGGVTVEALVRRSWSFGSRWASYSRFP